VKIRHLTAVHDVDDSRILRRECKSLAEAGYDVALVVGRAPRDDLAGVRVIGVGAAKNRLDRALRVTWNVYRAARRERADVYQFHDPELLWVGLALKLHGSTVVYDVHEDVPKQIMNKFWLPRWVRRPLAVAVRLAEHLASSVLDAIVVANPATAARFPVDKTVVVQNFPEVALARDDDSDLDFEQRPFAFAYTGGLSEVQGVREIMATGTALGPAMPGVLAGAFDDDRLEAEIRATPAWRSMCYVGRLPAPQVMATIRSARSGIALNRKVSNYFDAYSTKMFEYMACGIPVICSDFPHWVRVIDDADCGIAVDPRDPAAVAAAISKVATDPDEARRLGGNGRRAIIERYNWDNEFAKLDALYRRIT
jgi:glycosyltransferase involved in cell wall biosynthesis